MTLRYAYISISNIVLPYSGSCFGPIKKLTVFFNFFLQVYDKVVKLKNRNPKLKVLLSVNGDMSPIVQNHTTRKIFIKSSLEILRKHSLDGLDVDWEFPDDAWKFMTLLAEFRQAFGDRYLLTAAVAAPQVIVDISYKINVMSR